MSDTASNLASGSQDLAALLGLFCTDGVERNVLASQFGWGTVVASSLSLLGVLGLVKSSVKIALGLKHCASAGFNLDSIRGIFGFLPGETPVSGALFDCEVVSAQFSQSGLTITKTKRLFSSVTTPIVTVSRDEINIWEHQIVINLGNLRGEKAFRQNAILIFSVLVICSGLTTWLLEIVRADWTWVKIVAIPGLHACLILLVGFPLWYERQFNRPAKHLTLGKWDALMGKPDHGQKTLNLLQVRKNNIDVLHFWGNTAFINSGAVKLAVLFLSALAAVAYICQYSILKAASSDQALIWIGCQGALAAARLAYWVFDPSFDDSTVTQSECAELNVTGSAPLTMSELICNTAAGESLHIPGWALTFLRERPLSDVLHHAASRQAADGIPLDAEICALFRVDFTRIILRRWVENDSDSDQMFQIGLYRDKEQIVQPFIMIETVCDILDVESNEVEKSNCFMEAVWPPRCRNYDGNTGIDGTCTILALNESDHRRLHLRSWYRDSCDDGCLWRHDTTRDREQRDTWKFLGDRSRVCRWLMAITEDEHRGLRLRVTPGWASTVRVVGKSQRSFLKDRPFVLDYQEGLAQVRNYLEMGIQNPRENTWWGTVRRLISKQRKPTKKSAEKSANERSNEKTRSDVATTEV